MITIVVCGWLLQVTWELVYYSKPHSYVTLSPIQANRGCFFCLSVNSVRECAATLSLKIRTLSFEILLQPSQR